MSAAAATPSQASGRTVLAFDFGEKYVGVAIGDTETRLANPLGLIAAESNERRFAQIDAMVREWQPATLLVGVPLSLEGAERDITRRARRFARQLAARYDLPVALADERLSSADAQSTLREAGRGGRKHKHEVHALAAKVILQGWLDDPA